MNYRYVGLRIYSNFDWRIILHVLEENNYHWASGDKPTSLYFDTVEAIIYIDPITKTLGISRTITTTTSMYCKYYIEVR